MADQAQEQEAGKAAQQQSTAQQDNGQGTGQQEQSSGAEKSGGEKSGGDPREALRQERQRRKEEQQRRKSVEQRLAEIEQGQSTSEDTQGTGTGNGGEEGGLNIPEPDLTDDDLEDPESLKKKWNEYMQQVVPQLEERAVQRASQNVTASQNVQSEADAVLKKYSEFTQEDDPQARQDALRLLDAELASLPKGATIDDVDVAAAEVAKRSAKYRANKAAAESGGSEGSESEKEGEEGPASVGAGPAESAHLQNPQEPPKNKQEAKQRARKMSSNIFKKAWENQQT